ncbi:MAG: alkaline phosphatase family protein [Vicingus serpentipes]|nr:alkaline phosphatase family protein [Vicingus serpentipes]
MRFVILLFLLPLTTICQVNQPKLVIGIVVDQMRYDYLDRFWNKYTQNGFKKLVTEGLNCTNTHYNYMPTFTGPGHASIFTGTTPVNHGIIANNWHNKYTQNNVYCVEDTSFYTIGSTSNNGRMSPKQLLTSTVTDELKSATNNKGKVIGISIKDRGAILPAGHKADAAYWFDGDNIGQWITSSYYCQSLPNWLVELNKTNPAEQYLTKPWNTLFPINQYIESLPDSNPYEGLFIGEKAPVFPHDLPSLRINNRNYNLIKTTPFGNTILKELALVILKEEEFGKDDYTDFLTISFSSTDYIGHQYGPMSVEIEDTYLRLDIEIAELLNYIENHYQKEDVLIFLTADHGVVDVPQYLMDNNLSGGYFNVKKMGLELNTHLIKEYQTDKLIANISNSQIFLNHSLIKKNNLDLGSIETSISKFLLLKKGISKVFTSTELTSNTYTDTISLSIQKGFHHSRSGDILYLLHSGWIEHEKHTITTHGSPYNYDTHVPLIWFGAAVKANEINNFITIPDISATLFKVLNIQQPKSCTGKPISTIF